MTVSEPTDASAVRPKMVGLALRVFDYGAALAFGACAALAAWLLVPESWPAVVRMPLGMGVGCVAVVPLLVLFNWMLGGFEILMMAMQIGMVAGMAGPMLGDGTPTSVALGGTVVGLLLHLGLHVLDRSLHGDVAS